MAIQTIRDYKLTQKLNSNPDLLQLLPETRTTNVIQETERRFVEEHLIRLGGTYPDALSTLSDGLWINGTDVNTWSATIQQAAQTSNIVLTLPNETGTIALTTDLPTLVASDGLLDGTYNAGTFSFEPYTTKQATLLHFYTGISNPTHTARLNLDASFYTTSMNVSTALNVGTTLDVTGLSSLDGGIDVNGSLFTVSTAGTVYIGSTLEVDGTTQLDGIVNVNNVLNVTGLSSLDGGIDVNTAKFTVDATGATYIASTLEVDGTTQLDGTVNVNDTLNVTDLSSLDGGIDVNGNATIDINGNIVTAGDLAVNGGDITSSATTFNITPTNVTTLNLGGSGANVVIPGNLTVQGENFIAETTTVSTDDDIIQLRKSATLAMTEYAGLVATKYDGTNDGALVFDNSGTAWVGDVTIEGDGSLLNVSMQPLATRDITTNFINNNLIKWDSSLSRMVDQGDYLSNDTITISGGTDLETGGDFTLNQHGNETITLNHSNVTRTNSNAAAVNISPDTGGSFSAITGITSSATGHVTAVETTAINVPTPNNAIITLAAGLGLVTGGDFSTNQAGNETITFNLGTPSTLSSTTTNTAGADTHAHNITDGTLSGTASVVSVTGGGKVLDSNTVINLITGYGDTLNPYNSKAANTFLAAPNGIAGSPAFRTILNDDLPDTFADTPDQVYTAVQVNAKGIVTQGAHSIEVGAPAQATPSSELIIGGLFFLDVTPV